MLIYICAFTDRGRQLGEELNSRLTEDIVLIRNMDEEARDFLHEAWEKRAAIIFIGAAGIAVRMIAPLIDDKLIDSPVIVIDEMGRHVIPILSGHMGGANDLARRLSVLTGGEAVITTATDINDVFAIDVFARDNGLRIINRDGIARVSSKLLRAERANVYIDGNFDSNRLPDCIIRVEDKSQADICLAVKKLVIGVGCKRDTDPDSFEEFVLSFVKDWSEVRAITSIDIKAKELAIVRLASKYGIPYITYSAKELNDLEGDYTESDFVRETTGVGSICERSAAACLQGEAYHFVLRKTIACGMTIAIAKIAD